MGVVKVLGLPADRGRWLLIPLGLLVMLALGSVYAWSLFRAPLERELGLNATESLLPFTFGLVFYSAFMPITGLYLPRLGTRRATALGGLLVGVGYLLASGATTGGALVLAYGAIAGTGIGVAYGVPLLVMSRWFPDRRGLAMGLTVVGFGLSPLVTAPLANHWLTLYTVRPTLRLFGLVLMGVILALAPALKLPPPEWRPPTLGVETVGETPAPSPPLLQNRLFYGLWICYAIGTLVGLSAIGISSSVGQETIALDATAAARSVSLFALCNGGSRPLFGWLSDRWPPHRVATLSYGLMLVACFLMANAQAGQVMTYRLAFGLFWFCLGGWLATAPTLTVRFFAPERYAQNYGLVFTAYGTGALLGTLATGRLRDVFGSYQYVFYGMALLAIAGIVTAWTLLRSR
ncbi:MAG: OFA family MFS transporter [Pseudanabaenaceae cyanobacterium]